MFSPPGIDIAMWEARKTAFAAKSGLSDSPKTTRGLRGLACRLGRTVDARHWRAPSLDPKTK